MIWKKLNENEIESLCFKEEYEEVRKRYLPHKINILFIASNPHTGFFYCRNSPLYRATFKAFHHVFNINEQKFLDFFQEKGCYLYDLFPSERGTLKKIKEKIKNGQINLKSAIDDLAKFIEDEKPKVVVACFMDNDFNKWVDEAIAKSSIMRIKKEMLPFPRFGKYYFDYIKKLENIISVYLREEENS